MSTRILVAGEALIDIVHRSDGRVDEVPGGSPANVAITLGRLGREPHLLTRVGDDERGARLRGWLGASGVTIDGAPAPRTSTATARLDATGAARYEFAIDWDVDASALPAPDVLHTGSIGAFLEPGARAISDLVDRVRTSALITYDPNIRPTLVDEPDRVRGRVLSLVERADVVKASDEDLAWLHPGEDPLEVAARWSRASGALVVVTAGEAGAWATRGDAVLRAEPVRVDVVDTVGAGDTFMGALIDGLVAAGCAGAGGRDALRALDDGRLQSILTRSARAAAITVSRPGADPPTRAELDR